MRRRPLAALLVAAVFAGCAPDGADVAPPPGSAPEAVETVGKGKAEAYARASPEATPSPEAAPVRPPASEGEVVDRPDHVAFVEEFLRRQSVNDVADLAALYADRVRFYDLGVVDRSVVAEDKARFFERWPNRYYGLASPVRATGGGTPTLRFEYEFAVSQPGDARDREGRAWTEIALTPSGPGYVIASESGGTY